MTAPGRPLPPPMILALPRTRKLLNRFFLWLDRRKARRLAATNLGVLHHQWARLYAEWWRDGGWMEGAPPVENLDAARKFAVARHERLQHG